FGRRAREIMDAGNLVPDDVMVGIMDERLDRDDTRGRGFILDGFPRTVAQAEALERMTAPRGIDVAINLDLPREVALARLIARLMCADCGTNYSTADPPNYGMTCDVCGDDVVHRDDDTEAAIVRRLDLYEEETAPLIAYFDERGVLETVDAMGTPDTVSERLTSIIDKRRN
ncbi:MAG: nucleoside monophosphate kinase, partial [Acidobacteria bacterium]|nr:nucleoside monophosphate kinase [Acidobacteriota bacterium]